MHVHAHLPAYLPTQRTEVIHRKLPPQSNIQPSYKLPSTYLPIRSLAGIYPYPCLVLHSSQPCSLSRPLAWPGLTFEDREIGSHHLPHYSEALLMLCVFFSGHTIPGVPRACVPHYPTPMQGTWPGQDRTGQGFTCIRVSLAFVRQARKHSRRVEPRIG